VISETNDYIGSLDLKNPKYRYKIKKILEKKALFVPNNFAVEQDVDTPPGEASALEL